VQKKWIDAYLDMAERFAKLSYSKRLKVGAIVVKDNRVISIGYNGTPAGWDNTCEEVVDVSRQDPRYDYNHFSKELKTKKEVIHAEANAIGKLARDGEAGLGGTMFITHAPCLDCAKLIYQSGISSVLYRNSYRDTAGVNFLETCGVEVKIVLD
jgi:dCMP deaminase